MYFEVKQVKGINKSAPLSHTLQTGVKILVLGEPGGKTTLISACIDQHVDFENAPAYTIKFATNASSISEITGLYTTNKSRGKVWKSVIEFIAIHKIDAIWYCLARDFIDSNDELWHWVKCLSKVCKVILVRTKCLSPVPALSEEVNQRFPNNPPPVVSLLARDMQLNPKGGGAVVDAYGVDDLANITDEELKSRQRFSADAIGKLRKQAAKDEERYTKEEAHKGVILNSLRSLSGTGTDDEISKKDSLGDDDFELIPRPESPGAGFVNLVRSKQAQAAVGALMAFAVIRIASNYQ